MLITMATSVSGLKERGEGKIRTDEWPISGGYPEGVPAVLAEVRDYVFGDWLEYKCWEEVLDCVDGIDFLLEDIHDVIQDRRTVLDC